MAANENANITKEQQEEFLKAARDPSKPINRMQNIGPARIHAFMTLSCIAQPYGCGEKIGQFRDRNSLKEYSISALCQKCQDLIFGTCGEE